jgi:type I site-specific restriction endonuclease/predicted HTH transcriptional regulator
MSISVSKITKSQYKKILELEEGHFLDLKSKDIEPAKLTRSISAFANTDGGELYVGIAENKKTKTNHWEGFENVEAANGYLQIFYELFPFGQEFSYEFLSYESSLVLHIEIQRTRNIKQSSDNKTPYIRVGAQNLPVKTIEAITRLRRNKGIDSFEEETTSGNASELADSKPLIEFINKKCPHMEPIKWLNRQLMICNDKATVCGVLLFAEEPQAIIPKHCDIKIYRYRTGDEKGNRDLLDSDPITIEGWIYQQIKLAVEKTIEIVEEIPKLGARGLENVSYPRETLHEIITNAVLHRDYSFPNDIHIRIFDNRIEIESPGRLPGHITVNNILEQSFPRNPRLVRYIHKFPNPPNKDIGEGLDTAFSAMQQLRLKPPVIQELENKVIVYIYHEALASPEETILKYFEEHTYIKTSIARKICHIESDSKMRNILRGLIEKNLIEPVPGLKGSASAYRKFEEKVQEKFDYNFKLRDYQIKAIQAIETALIGGQRNLIVAMAAGTGKTVTCAILIYRLLKSRRFRKVLFLVDRTDLLKQTIDTFKKLRIENLQTFAEIFEVKELKNRDLNQFTKVHIATVQSFNKRFGNFSNKTATAIAKEYDCIVLDECYWGGWQRITQVLEPVDAVKLCLMATPTLQATQIFGEPIYTYSYREAVIDGWLTDHEIFSVRTSLSTIEMDWNPLKTREFLDVQTGQVDLVYAPDEVEIEIEQFNRSLVSKEFNQAVCEELAMRLDLSLPEKTLIFCVSDEHADIVVNQLKIALTNQYGSINDEAVVKITSKAEKPLWLIERFRYEPNLKIAVTVDLLTTGVDIPAICNLVFLRRVNSRTLYGQMLGRATRRCDEIGKEVFRVFDAVDLYSAMASGTDISPVGVNPNVSFSQLISELETTTDPGALETILDQLLAKLQHKQHTLTNVDKNSIETLIQMPFDDIAVRLRNSSPTQAVQWLRDKADIIQILDGQVKQDDVVVESDPNYVITEPHQAYLDNFNTFVHENLKKIPALLLVTQRPQELTRSQLKELRSLMDTAGYSEQRLQGAWRDMTNNDIAASIVGFIRQATLEEPLIPYSDRVDRAMNKLLISKTWTAAQTKWLERIGQQFKVELIVDRDALERGQFKASGGFERINTIFEERLEEILREINDALWHELVNK